MSDSGNFSPSSMLVPRSRLAPKRKAPTRSTVSYEAEFELQPVTAVDQRVLANHALDQAALRLAAVDHAQDRLIGIEPRSTRSASNIDTRVAVSLLPSPSPERDLHAIGATVAGGSCGHSGTVTVWAGQARAPTPIACIPKAIR